MDFLKNIWSKITGSLSGIGQYLGLLKQLKTLKDTFPGIDREKELRTWVINQANNFEPFALKTTNKVDDKILVYARNVALNEKAFSSIYNLLLLGYELIPAEEPSYGNVCSNGVYEIAHSIFDKGTDPKDALVIMAAIGLIFQVIQFLHDRNS